jgi:3-phenylpropionate/cinnamic acid dioxygenase small subunit
VSADPSAPWSALARRLEVSDLCQAYAECLDSGDLRQWPSFFTADGVYRAQGRENYDRGLPLCAMSCEGAAMLQDRVTVIVDVMVYAPRTIRHVVSAPTVIEDSPTILRARSSFCAFHTLPHEPTTLLSVGRYEDLIKAGEGGSLKFQERIAIYDSLLIPGSLVYPL